MPSRFSLVFAAVTLLVTAVMAGEIWEGYFPDPEREARRRRREYYEKVLRDADVSWKEGLYYRVMEAPGRAP